MRKFLFADTKKCRKGLFALVTALQYIATMHDAATDTSQAPEQYTHLRDMRERLRDIPLRPGVYLFKDAAGRVVYVGKAKVLRKRVGSYFLSLERQTPKTRAMLARARSIDTLCTATEKEALLLEASLIKKHRPRYNVVLRDDKQYVLFRLDKNADFPRLTLTRKVARDQALYFGPFTSAQAARATWKVIHKIFPLRRCSDRSMTNRVRPCLYHHIGLCLAPCVLEVSKEDYANMVRRVEMFLAGRSGELTAMLRQEMQRASDSLDFEFAAVLRDQIRAVERTVEQQAAVLPGGADMDVLGLAQTSSGLALGLLFVRQGRLIDRKNFYWPGLSLEDGREVLEGFVGQYYGPQSFIPERVVLPWSLDDLRGEEREDQTFERDADAEASSDPEPQSTQALLAQVLSEHRQGHVRVTPPCSGAEKQLVALAGTNAREAALHGEQKPLLDSLAEKLRLPAPPRRIEAVDISHHGGQEPRAGVVVFQDGEPCKEEYRVYIVPPEVPAGDDYGALAAWLERRLASGPPWPDLLLVDGGKGQLAAVEKAMEQAGQSGLFPLAGIAKEKVRSGGQARRKTHGLEDSVYLPGRKNPLALKPGSPELLFLQHVRDSVHNFAIGRHRRARRKTALSGELLRLQGVGPKTARLLWEHFPNVQAMAEASETALAAIPGIGKKKAAMLARQLRALRI